MGEVYRAIDTTLKRAVGIKVLPASVAGDAHRLARLEREAEVLASLNHPNIAAIYGVQPWEGSIALDGRSIRVGDRVTIAGAPSMRARPEILARNVLLPNGNEFSFGSPNPTSRPGKPGVWSVG